MYDFGLMLAIGIGHESLVIHLLFISSVHQSSLSSIHVNSCWCFSLWRLGPAPSCSGHGLLYGRTPGVSSIQSLTNCVILSGRCRVLRNDAATCLNWICAINIKHQYPVSSFKHPFVNAKGRDMIVSKTCGACGRCRANASCLLPSIFLKGRSEGCATIIFCCDSVIAMIIIMIIVNCHCCFLNLTMTIFTIVIV